MSLCGCLPGATGIHILISVIDAPPTQPNGTIAGNVYSVDVTDQAGAPLAIATCDRCLSLSMRAPQGTDVAIVELFANGAWKELDTLPVGIVSMYQVNPTVLGVIAVVTPSSNQPGASGQAFGPLQPAATGIDPLIIFGVGAVLLWLLVFAFIAWQRLRPAPLPGAAGGTGGRRPSKQRPPRRPGSGRNN